ncbi:MAG: hypothetical protein RLZ12_186 [Bacillota bacterium]
MHLFHWLRWIFFANSLRCKNRKKKSGNKKSEKTIVLPPEQAAEQAPALSSSSSAAQFIPPEVVTEDKQQAKELIPMVAPKAEVKKQPSFVARWKSKFFILFTATVCYLATETARPYVQEQLAMRERAQAEARHQTQYWQRVNDSHCPRT